MIPELEQENRQVRGPVSFFGDKTLSSGANAVRKHEPDPFALAPGTGGARPIGPRELLNSGLLSGREVIGLDLLA